jgi:hypothetical protein
MKTSIFRKGTYSLRTTLIAAMVGVLSVPNAFSTIVFQDDFQGYADDAALQSVWSRVSGTSSSIFLTGDPMNAANYAIQQTTAAGRLRYVINGGVVPTTQEPTITFSFDLYDSNGGTANGRVYGELRNSAVANGLLAAGIYNSVNVGVLDTTKYQARSVDGGQWIQLEAARSVGWHNFRFEITGNQADLYVDNALQPSFTDRAAGNVSYDWINMGSGLSGNSSALFDNVTVSTVPEPSVVALSMIGLGAVLGRIWLRRRN